MMANNGNPTGREAAAERRIQALEMRKAGYSYRKIGETLGVSTASAFFDVRKELDKLAKIASEVAEEVRVLELARLDDLYVGLSDLLAEGSLGAIDRALRIMERRAKLLGLDAPDRVEDVTESPVLITVDV